MTGAEFKAIRQALGLTQRQLANVLGYAHPVRVSEFERTAWPQPVPKRVAALMTAFASGYRPRDWPQKPAHKAAKRRKQPLAA
jgi:transcriptional regulator with XRE-family HTH domain